MRIIVLLLSLLWLSIGYADNSSQNTNAAQNSFPVVNWVSENSDNEVTVNNSAGIPIIVVVTVDPNGAGIDISNCGNTTHLDPGSTTICRSDNSQNSVTISSESTSDPASGTYQIKPVPAQSQQQQQ